MNARARALREKKRKILESIGYTIEPSGGGWVIKMPTGIIIQHYVYEATAISGAWRHIEKTEKDHDTGTVQLNKRWTAIVEHWKQLKVQHEYRNLYI